MASPTGTFTKPSVKRITPAAMLSSVQEPMYAMPMTGVKRTFSIGGLVAFTYKFPTKGGVAEYGEGARGRGGPTRAPAPRARAGGVPPTARPSAQTQGPTALGAL